MRFAFEAVDADGRREHGELAAADERAALKALAARRLTALSLVPKADAPAVDANGRISSADRALAVRQLSGLIDGGVTLPAALQSVAQSSAQPTVAAELRAVHAALDGGEPLVSAFGKASKLLPLVERQVVVAGAEAGDLARVLARLADYLEERDALRGKLVGAMVYPAVVGVVALAVIVALLVFVMPQIVAAFAQTKQQLPWLTRSLLLVATGLRQYGIWLIALLLAASVFALWSLRGPLRQRGLALLQRLPLLGPLAQSADEVRVLTTLAMLVESAVPLPRAMVAAATTARFASNATRLDAARNLIERGSAVTTAFTEAQALDGMSLELLRHGEAVGGVAAAFAKAAHLKRQGLERRLQWFATLVEPVMILVLGGVVLLLVLAVMLPIVTLNSAVR
ncbi:type II secretion system F family protein [Casimicrobium huifangae]|uniref:type II secretion system F family protein n=1 Tax=Casimicrobium huifangae TaxID=2591109 RepID=UPI0012EBFDB8|nr:type II secretion system F family protein [Casimicrobium huifangae]